MDLRQGLINASLLGVYNQDLLVLYAKGEEFLNFLDNGILDLELEKCLSKYAKNKLLQYQQTEFDSVLRYIESNGIQIFVLGDEDYPYLLTLIDVPPVVLYTRGDESLFKEKGIAIVGARKHTDYGRRIGAQVTKELIEYGVIPISGLALGIDSICHKCCIEEDHPTIAVLGNGIDQCYPKSNTHIWKQIMENGLIISEYPPGVSARPNHFPQRNRIIAGLSEAIIVIEAQQRSGSLITARLGAEMGKEVFAIPGNIDSLYSRGTNQLICDGANPYLEIDDLLQIIPDLKENKANKKIEKLKDLSEVELQVLRGLQEGYTQLDKLAIKLSIDTSLLLSTLTILELKGYITNTSSDEYVVL